MPPRARLPSRPDPREERPFEDDTPPRGTAIPRAAFREIDVAQTIRDELRDIRSRIGRLEEKSLRLEWSDEDTQARNLREEAEKRDRYIWIRSIFGTVLALLIVALLVWLAAAARHTLVTLPPAAPPALKEEKP